VREFATSVTDIETRFRASVQAVDKLMDFDDLVLEYAIKSVDELCNRLKKARIENVKLTGEITLKQLKDIREHKSMRTNYQEIFNQGVVLLVSYFGSALQDLFEESVAHSLSRGGQQSLLKEELKIAIADLKHIEFDLTHHIGEFLISSKNISFQDMQSIRRAFHDYLDIDPERDKIANNIILGQACRHVIVHSGAMVDTKLKNQVGTALPRTLKLDLSEDTKVQFQPDEVKTLGQDMLKFVGRIVQKLKTRWKT
jgi:hypothetical protein